MQEVVAPTWVPDLAGYDTREQNNKNIPRMIRLDNAAMTFLTMAATPKFAAAVLQDTIYVYHRGGGFTEPKLFLYHDQVRDDKSRYMYLEYAQTKADKRRQAMKRRGMTDWKNLPPRSETVQPNRACVNAIWHWINVDGAANDYFVTIRDRVYCLKNEAMDLKLRGTPPQDLLWSFFNILNPFLQWLQTDDAKKCLQHRRWGYRLLLPDTLGFGHVVLYMRAMDRLEDKAAIHNVHSGMRQKSHAQFPVDHR